MGALDGPEELTFADPARGTYARLVIDGDRLAGAVGWGGVGAASPHRSPRCAARTRFMVSLVNSAVAVVLFAAVVPVLVLPWIHRHYAGYGWYAVVARRRCCICAG